MKIILLIALFVLLPSCSKPVNHRNIAHSDSLSVISNALLGEWKSTREPGKSISIITSYPVSKDSNMLLLDKIGSAYFVLDSTRNNSNTLVWSMQLPTQDGNTSNIYILKLTGDTLHLWEESDLVSGIYLKAD